MLFYLNQLIKKLNQLITISMILSSTCYRRKGKNIDPLKKFEKNITVSKIVWMKYLNTMSSVLNQDTDKCFLF